MPGLPLAVGAHWNSADTRAPSTWPLQAAPCPRLRGGWGWAAAWSRAAPLGQGRALGSRFPGEGGAGKQGARQSWVRASPQVSARSKMLPRLRSSQETSRDLHVLVGGPGAAWCGKRLCPHGASRLVRKNKCFASLHHGFPKQSWLSPAAGRSGQEAALPLPARDQTGLAAYPLSSKDHPSSPCSNFFP